jgi:hypothetical protein
MTTEIAREVLDLIATRNRPLLTALDLCMEQLERFGTNDQPVQYALKCAQRAAQQERGFQARAGVASNQNGRA